MGTERYRIKLNDCTGGVLGEVKEGDAMGRKMSEIRVSRVRLTRMIAAAQALSAFSPDRDRYRWLSDAWQVILGRITRHREAGRVRQAEVWKVAARFFARRYDGKFSMF